MNNPVDDPTSTLPVTKRIEMEAFPQLTSWMFENKLSFLFTLYQTGKLFLIGLKPDGNLSIDVVYSLQISGIVTELYDVCVIPNTFMPMALGLQTDEIRRVITLGGTL